MDINKIESTLKMEGFYFPKCFIERNEKIIEEPLQFDLQRNIKKINQNEYCVTLTFIVTKEHNDLYIVVTASANFVFESDDEELTETIIQKNTVAIMFPFIRSQVSLMSTQPGLSPIVLPPINTSNL